MRLKVILIALILIFTNSIKAQVNNSLNDDNFEKLKAESRELFKFPRFDSRRITGLAYSSFVPGSGQIYLGHTTKGAAFAISFFTSLVGAVVSQNNFIGNGERIKSLEYEYLNADRYTLAEYYWKQMVSVHEEQKRHEKARNIFIIATASIWTVNIVDYLFFTKDKGPIEFSLNYDSHNRNSISFSMSVPLK